MSDTVATIVEKRLGGTRFPFINLEKAMKRAQQLFAADQKGREMSTAALFGVWDYSEKSSGGYQTIAALKGYGLLQSTGTKMRLSDSALRYFRDEREDERKKLLRQFALSPKLIRGLWKEWHATPPADTVARSHLKAERGLSEQGSRTLLAIYKENLAFSELTADDKLPETDAGEQGEAGAVTPPPQSPLRQGKVAMMQEERVVFTEENNPQTYVKLIARGEVDDTLLEALEDYVKRQRKRLQTKDAAN